MSYLDLNTRNVAIGCTAAVLSLATGVVGAVVANDMSNARRNECAEAVVSNIRADFTAGDIQSIVDRVCR